MVISGVTITTRGEPVQSHRGTVSLLVQVDAHEELSVEPLDAARVEATVTQVVADPAWVSAQLDGDLLMVQ